MLLQILAAAKAKRDQARLESKGAATTDTAGSTEGVKGTAGGGVGRVPSSVGSVASSNSSRRPSLATRTASHDSDGTSVVPSPKQTETIKAPPQKRADKVVPKGRQQEQPRTRKAPEVSSASTPSPHTVQGKAGLDREVDVAPPALPVVPTAAAVSVGRSAANTAAAMEVTVASDAAPITTIDLSAISTSDKGGPDRGAFSAAHALLYRTSTVPAARLVREYSDDCRSEGSDDSLLREVSRYTADAPLTPGDFGLAGNGDTYSDAHTSAAADAFSAHLTRTFSSASGPSPVHGHQTQARSQFASVAFPSSLDAPAPVVGSSAQMGAEGGKERVSERQPSFSPLVEGEERQETGSTVSLASLSGRTPVLTLPPGIFPSASPAPGPAPAPVSVTPVSAGWSQPVSIAGATPPVAASTTEVGGEPPTVSVPVTTTPTIATAAANTGTTPELPSSATPATTALPVDAHRERILQHVRQYPVTIINGMTGCGKSTRIPVMIWEDHRATASTDGADGSAVAETSALSATPGKSAKGSDAYVMVSQPRRIAATALKNRLAQSLGDVVGLRLGKGRREETPNTRIWFVTTGYLVRLLAHKLPSFARFTHLVIDEIHERSLDCDLLCYLAKRLLYVYPHMKIVLMSATAHSAMFQTYFHSAQEAIFVGVRRFPLVESFAEELHPLLTQAGQKALNRLLEALPRCASRRGITEVVPDYVVKEQLQVAAALARSVARPGGAVLIFVSGMADITDLMELLTAQLQSQRQQQQGGAGAGGGQGKLRGQPAVSADKTLLLAVHSDIPHEQQLLAFQPTQPDEVKIVIATNAAESSVTIPDVDHVICLGTSKVLTYSAKQHTTQLVNSWISKASATQRAGRTGRVRPGSVYHIYSRALYDCMADYDVSEVHRQPMTEVALRLKSMLASVRPSETRAGKRSRSGTEDTGVDTVDTVHGTDSTDEDVEGTEKPVGLVPVPSSDSSEAEAPPAASSTVRATTTTPVVPAVSSVPALPGVTAVLRALIEPPSLQSIHDALCTLYECGMLTSPLDDSQLTEIGSLSAELPVDFMLGRFLGYAVLLGVAREAVVVAAALSSGKSVFRTPNQLLQTDIDEFNSHCRQLFLSMHRLDRGLLSEPMMAVQAFVEYQRLAGDRERLAWCKEHCIVPTRMRQLGYAVQNLYGTVYGNLQAPTSGAEGGHRHGTGNVRVVRGVRRIHDDTAYKASLAALQPLTTRSVNALRLCMVWAFPHHILRQKTILASEEQMCTADLPQLSLQPTALRAFLQGQFTSPSALQSFPAQRQGEVSLPYKVVTQGKRTYIADLLDRSFEALLDAFLTLLSDLAVDVAWLTSSYTKPDNVLIVYDRDVAEDKLHPYLVSIFGTSLARLNSSGDRAILKAPITARSQLTKLSEVFNEDRWKILSWDLPGSGAASLVCSNCVPSDRQLRNLFLGRDLASRLGTNDLSEVEYQQWGRWAYRSKIARSKLKLVFPEDTPSAYANGGSSAAVAGDAMDTAAQTRRQEVLRNIPLALQLINFVRYNANSDRHLRLTVPERGAGGAADDGSDGEFGEYPSNVTSPLPSPSQAGGRLHSSWSGTSTEWYDRRSPTGVGMGRQDARSAFLSGGGGGGGSSQASSAVQTTNIRLQTVRSEWTKLPTASSDDSLLGASDESTAGADYVTFPPFSLQRFAQHLDNDPVYAIAYSLMVTTRSPGPGQSSAGSDTGLRAEGVTLLPVGSPWLSLALACVSRLDPRVVRNFKDGCTLSAKQCGLAERVCQYLSHCSVRYCFQKPFNPLSADLDELFKSWVRPDRGQGQLISGTPEPAFDVADMSQFMPLGAGATTAAKEAQSYPTASSQDTSREGSPAQLTASRGASAPPSPARPSSSTNAWLSTSTLVRSAGPLAQTGRGALKGGAADEPEG